MITKEGKGAKQEGKRQKKYEMVADRLRACIDDGVYTRKLPGVRVLSEELETNPMTLGTAIKLLVDEGLLYRIPKSGTYIKKQEGGRKGAIALLVSSIEAPITSRALERISAVASNEGLNLLFFNHGNNEDLEMSMIKRIAREKLADGVIWWPSSQSFGAKAQDILVNANVPFVVLEIPWIGIKGTSVAPDQFAAFRALTRHLVDQGCRKILFVGDHALAQTEPKFLAYRSVLEEEGLEPELPYVISREMLDPSRRNELDAVVEKVRSVDALVCLYDLFAAKLYQALADRGVSIPDDVLMVGCDGLGVTELLGITTFTQPIEAIGDRSAEDLLSKIKAEGDETPPNQSHFLKGKLIVRKSSTRPVAVG